MTIHSDRECLLDRESREIRYYRNAVERHWDPATVALDADAANLVAFLEEAGQPAGYLDGLRVALARFGAGEQAVTEDLAPLAVALEAVDDQLFVTTQLYEEAKHTDFFDRYWREVIHATETELGLERSSPTDPRWFNDAYLELFERTERAMAALLEDDSAETFARAYTHYHLVIEGILAQTGYYGLQRSYGEDTYPELPHLPGLCAGLGLIRQDEGRHVGFGMVKLKALVATGSVETSVLEETVAELMPLVTGIVADDDQFDDLGVPPEELYEFAAEKHLQRMSQITDETQAVPGLEQLTALDTVEH